MGFGKNIYLVEQCLNEVEEITSWKWTLFAVSYQTGIEWAVAFLICNIGKLIGLS